MGAAIAIVRAAACGAMGADIAAMVDALRTDRSGVGPSDMLEQVPAVAAGVGEVPLGIRHGAQGDMARGDASALLHAQASAAPFYLRAGYSMEGDPFEEAGIPHLAMRKAL